MGKKVTKEEETLPTPYIFTKHGTILSFRKSGQPALCKRGDPGER